MTKKHNDAQTPWLDADEIKKHVTIEQVLKKYGLFSQMQLRGRKLAGHSLLQSGDDLFFSADLERNIWNDFSGKPDNVPGNVIGLVQVLERCSFRDALVILHRDYVSSTLAGAESSPAQENSISEENEVTHAQPTPNEPFGRILNGRSNIPFLLDQGISEETIKKFGVVYCTSGLMKGRVAFPIRNTADEVVAYAGRAVKPADSAVNGKYRFPPGFSREMELYNIDRLANQAESQKAAKDFGIIVVNGFTDVLKLHNEGFPNAAAIMGYELYPQQQKLLLSPQINPTRRLTLFFNNNEPGAASKRAAAQRCIHQAFIRYAAWEDVPHTKKSPVELTREELTAALGFYHKQ